MACGFMPERADAVIKLALPTGKVDRPCFVAGIGMARLAGGASAGAAPAAPSISVR